MCHADKCPARHVHRSRKAFTRYIDYASLQRFLRRKGDGMDQEIKLAPLFGNSFKDSFKLARRADVERQHDWRFKRPGKRLDKFFCFVVEIRHGEIGTEGPKSLCAAPGN